MTFGRGTQLWWALGSLTGAAAIAGCHEAPARNEPMMNQQQTANPTGVRLEFEGVRLGASFDEVLALIAARGWRHNAAPEPTADQTVTVFTVPEHPVKRFKLGLQGGALTSIQIDYRVDDPARGAALRAAYPRSKHAPDGWTMADAGGLTLVFIDDAGRKSQALYTGMLRDRTEVTALFRQALDEAPTGGPAIPPP
jgi:hypothetical protein